MTKIYTDKDTNLKTLKGKKISIIGYGSQGHAHAQNLRDSGLKVIVGQRKGSPNYSLAVKHGFKPLSADKATQQGDLIALLIPDELQASVYENEIKPHLKKGKTLLFSHGFNIHFGQVVPPDYIDVIMVAPKEPGHLVRSEYVKGGGVPCLMAIQQNLSKNADKVVLAYAGVLGWKRRYSGNNLCRGNGNRPLWRTGCIVRRSFCPGQGRIRDACRGRIPTGISVF